MNNYTEQNSTS